MGFETEPAPTNDPTKRIDAVNSYIIKLVDGEPGYLVSRKCPMVRKGKIGGYQYKRVQMSGEARYRDKPDKNKYSHCFVANTMISTNAGDKKISDIKIGDYVLTPIGNKKITHLMGRVTKDLVELTLSDGNQITCTGDHPFYTRNGIVQADALQYTDVLYGIGEKPLWADHLSTKYKHSTGLSFTKNLMDILRRIIEIPAMPRYTCTAMCGSSTVGQYQAITTYTTKMKTKQTTISKISGALSHQSIFHFMQNNGTKETLFSQKKISTEQGTRLQSGMAVERVLSSTKNLALYLGRASKKSHSNALGAARNTKVTPSTQGKAFVQCHAKVQLGKHQVSMTSIALVAFASQCLKLINIAKRKHVLRVVEVKRLAGQERVYDLTVDEAHCFYANGVLVSNCADAEQYMALGFAGGYVLDSNDNFDEEYDDFNEVGIMGY
jgi:hypothetical protein